MTRVLLVTSSHPGVLGNLLAVKLQKEMDGVEMFSIRVTHWGQDLGLTGVNRFDWALVSVHGADLGMEPSPVTARGVEQFAEQVRQVTKGVTLIEAETPWSPFTWVEDGLGRTTKTAFETATANLALADYVRERPSCYLVHPSVDSDRDVLCTSWIKTQPSVPHQATVNVFVRTMRTLKTQQVKVIACDFDGVLWGGVASEGSQALGTEFPNSSWKLVQKFLLECKQRGYVLVGTTKNTPETVTKAFSHPDMVLTRRDFAHICADWRPKSEHLREISTALNLKLDSFIFLDDNEADLLEVSSSLPEVVLFPQFSNRTLATSTVLYHLSQLECLRKGAGEDRTPEYLVEKHRQAQTGTTELTPLQVRLYKNEHLRRAEELLERTTQFNLTGFRPSADEIASGKYDVYVLAASDRYGSLGAVGAVIAEKEIIRNMVMSCRVLGRGLEEALAHLVSEDRDPKHKGLVWEYKDTGRNKAVQAFYNGHGPDFLIEMPGHISFMEERVLARD